MKEIIFEYDDTESYPNMTKRAVQFLKRETPKDNRIFLLQYVTMTSLLPPSKQRSLLVSYLSNTWVSRDR